MTKRFNMLVTVKGVYAFILLDLPLPIVFTVLFCGASIVLAL
jgi:hypothetical protein